MASERCFRAARRRFLQCGTLGLASGGLTLSRLLETEANGSALRRTLADHAILVFLDGGPSHLDMWDMKPEAPEGIRGEFKPIATSLAGYQMCEHLPRLARQMHQATVVRSMHHSVNNSHGAAVYTALTGHDRGEAGGLASPTDHPHMGAVLAKLQPGAPETLSHVHLPYITQEGAGNPPQPGFFGGFLGRSYDPLFVLSDPNAADFNVPELSLRSGVSLDRLAARRQLFGTQGDELGSRAAREVTVMQQRAMDLLSSDRVQRAFRLSDEADNQRQRYGRNVYGQSVLLARRLIEAGTRLVTVSWAPHANATWDTHGSNFISLKNTLLPQLDAAVSSLVSDLDDRGLLARTIVAVFGDFGRTPRINANKGGRDHWNFCYSLMLIGGGFRQGYIHGSSDATGAFPASQPLVPGDVLATMYHALGVPYADMIHDQLGRPHRIVPAGDPVPHLLA
jgi:hypothetical protein